MKKKLMYGENSDPGWSSCNIYGEREVGEIVDPTNTKQNKRKDPRVSVPSPFARFELVQKAFANVAAKGILADMRDIILVSNALDVFELFYEGAEGLELVEWRKNDAIKALNESVDAGNKLYGQSLELYMRQENYGFDSSAYHRYNNVAVDDVTIYILTYNREPVGCTSPTSMFLATSRPDRFKSSLSIEGNMPLFATKKRMLAERDDAFIEYVYRCHACMKQFQDTVKPLTSFFDYLKKQLEIVRNTKPQLYRTINELFYTEEELSNVYSETPLRVLGFKLYQRRAEDLQDRIKNESAFVIDSTKSDKKPLVLTNNSTYNGWPYLSRSNTYSCDSHRIDYTAIREMQTRKKLPGTETEYEGGWLCENDFLSDVLVQLPYPLDTIHFFNGNLVNATKYYYLPPIRSRYFEYFDIDTIYDPSGTSDRYGSEKRLKIEEVCKGETVEKVIVTLLVPVRCGENGGQVVRLVREYIPDEKGFLTAGSSSKERSVGRIVECPIAVNIFPFARLESKNHYRIQSIHSADNLDGFSVKMTAWAKGASSLMEWDDDWERNTGKTHYYSLNNAFDYFRIRITDGTRRHESVLIPIWGRTYSGSLSYKFSFDFGTTNSHIAVLRDEKDIIDFKVGKSIVSTLNQKDKYGQVYRDEITNILTLDVLMKQEWLPEEIGVDYTFPLRTVVLRNVGLNLDVTTPRALEHINIPFIYGKEDYGQSNMPVPNLKWTVDPEKRKLSVAFIEELALLARAFAIENNGDLSKCSFVWTYPLSMRKSDADEFDEEWNKYYINYFSGEEGSGNANVSRMTESIAPLLYYQSEHKDLDNMGLSIDIGGGTCDVVVKRNNEDIKFTSFRYAADVIFGAGKASENPMIQKHYDYFSRMLKECKKKNSDVQKIIDMMKKACESDVEATEANSVLFALESHPLLQKVAKADKSYNVQLKNDRLRKVIFLYFYASIVYYLTRLLQDFGYPQPARFMFSGTGSKMLNIIGSVDDLKELTTSLIQTFSGGKYSYKIPVDIVIETKEPKQITAKGALHVIQKGDDKDIAKRYSNPKKVEEDTIRYSLVNVKDEQGNLRQLLYEDLNDESIKNTVVSEVERFHKLFIDCFGPLNFVDDYHCDEHGLSQFKDLMQQLEPLKDYMNTEIRDFDRHDVDKYPKNVFEGSLFFYPIKYILQHKIIPNLK